MDTNNLNAQEAELREQDRWLPIANVARLMKNTLPTTAKVSKDAKECMQECVSEFISFITSEASDRCIKEKRKTINGEDILYSMHDLGFENYAEVLKIYLAKYREQQVVKQERNDKRSAKKQKRDTADGQGLDYDDVSSSNTPLTEEYQELQSNSVESQHYNGENFHQDEHEPGSHELNNAVGTRHSSESSLEPTSGFFGRYPEVESQMNESRNEDKNGDNSTNPVNMDSEHKVMDYRYNEFIADPNEEGINNHLQHINDLTKQLGHDESDIDTLAAGITSTNSNNEYI